MRSDDKKVKFLQELKAEVSEEKYNKAWGLFTNIPKGVKALRKVLEGWGEDSQVGEDRIDEIFKQCTDILFEKVPPGEMIHEKPWKRDSEVDHLYADFSKRASEISFQNYLRESRADRSSSTSSNSSVGSLTHGRDDG